MTDHHTTQPPAATWRQRSLTRQQSSRASFDALEFERELQTAEHQLRLASTQIHTTLPTTTSSTNPLPTSTSTSAEPLLSRFNLLASGTEAWQRHHAQTTDARLAYPKATLIVTGCAWILALVAAIIAVTFLTRDYVGDRRNKVRTITLERMEEVRMPVVSFCTTAYDGGMFPVISKEGGKDVGFPLFTVRTVSGGGGSRGWPEVFGREVGIGWRGGDGEVCEERFGNVVVDPGVTNRLHFETGSECQVCYQVGRERSIVFKREEEEKSVGGGLFEDKGLKIQMLRFLAYEECLDVERNIASFRPDVALLIARIIRDRIDDLIKEGILNEEEEGQLKDEDNLDSALPISQDNNTPNDDTANARDLYCNVYFKSGFFYPKNDDNPIPRYDLKIESQTFANPMAPPGSSPTVRKKAVWTRREGGTYFPEYPVNDANISTLVLPNSRPSLLRNANFSGKYRPIQVYIENPSEEVESRKIENSDILGGSTMYRVGENAKLITELERSMATRILLTREENEGAVKFSANADSRQLEVQLGKTIYESNVVTIQMESFFSQKLDRRVSQSTMQYIVDLLGYISFAFGFTVYSLIVAPSNIFFFGLGQERRNRDANTDVDGTEGFDATGAPEEVDIGDKAPTSDQDGGRMRSAGPRLRFGLSRRNPGAVLSPKSAVNA